MKKNGNILIAGSLADLCPWKYLRRLPPFSEAEKIGISLKNCPRSRFFQRYILRNFKLRAVEIPMEKYSGHFSMAAPLIWRFFSRCSFHFLKGKKQHTKKPPKSADAGRPVGRGGLVSPPEKKKVDFGDGSGLQSAGALAATECGWRVVTDQPDGDCWWRGGKVEIPRWSLEMSTKSTSEKW